MGQDTTELGSVFEKRRKRHSVLRRIIGVTMRWERAVRIQTETTTRRLSDDHPLTADERSASKAWRYEGWSSIRAWRNWKKGAVRIDDV